MAVLPRRFYARPSPEVARDLLGHELVWRVKGESIGGVIVEVEAYAGAADPASHAYRGPTPRNQVMFGRPGHAYVYFTYGMHHCVNIVTGREGEASAVLVRALAPHTGIERWRERRPDLPLALAGSGPGRVCRALGLDRTHDGLDLVHSELVVRARPRPEGARILAGPRVGIRVARTVRWRFWLAGSPSVSRAKGSSAGPWPSPASAGLTRTSAAP